MTVPYKAGFTTLKMFDILIRVRGAPKQRYLAINNIIKNPQENPIKQWFFIKKCTII